MAVWAQDLTTFSSPSCQLGSSASQKVLYGSREDSDCGALQRVPWLSLVLIEKVCPL